MNTSNTEDADIAHARNIIGDCPNKPNCVSTCCSNAAQRMPSLRFECDSSEALAQVSKVCEAMPRMQLVEQRDDYLHFVDRTPLLRFRDDVYFLVNKETHRLHFRSASRLGYSDLGANRKRMNTIVSALLESKYFSTEADSVEE